MEFSAKGEEHENYQHIKSTYVKKNWYFESGGASFTWTLHPLQENWITQKVAIAAHNNSYLKKIKNWKGVPASHTYPTSVYR